MADIWITGASQGLGRALAERYLAQGYTVFATARRPAPLQALASQNRVSAGTLVPMPADIRDPASVHRVVEQIRDARRHRADTPLKAILNAGTHRHQPADQFQSRDISPLVELNLMGTVYCIEALLPLMLSEQQGQIAMVASLAGYRGLPNASGYGATKAALINLAESLKLDLESRGVDIRLINPGFVKTPLTNKNRFPMPDLISAEEAARIIASGLDSHQFEIRFPFRFAGLLGLLRHLPYWLYLPLIRRSTGVR